MKINKPRVLLLDIETSPILAHVWSLWDQSPGLNQVERDWFILSWSAKWLDEDNVMYADQRKSRNLENDKPLLKKIWVLLDQADIVITQNGKKFDIRKLNARFIMNGFKPPSSFKQIDTLILAKKHFGFTSNKLEYMSDKLCKKYKKLTKKKYAGFTLWRECLIGNQEAWREMEVYNKLDVLSLEELYYKLIPWDNSINFNLYSSHSVNTCKCGSDKFKRNGFDYSATSKYQRYKCTQCGAETRDRKNLFTKDKMETLRVNVKR